MPPRNPLDITQAFDPGRRTVRRSLDDRLGLRPPAAGETDSRSRRLLARLLARLVSALLEPPWYWFDLFGQDDHPSNTKVVATLSIVTGLTIALVLAIGFVIRGATPDLEYYGFAIAIIGGAAGWDSYKTRVKTRAAVDVIRSGQPIVTESHTSTRVGADPAVEQ